MVLLMPNVAILLEGTLENVDFHLKGGFHNTEIKLEGTFGTIIGGAYPVYEGPYVVTPKVVEQEFDTDHKSMKDDLLVEAIPFVEVSNIYGGTTITIGGQ